MNWAGRIEACRGFVRKRRRVPWKSSNLGIAAARGIHEAAPEGQLAGIMGGDWWSVPLSVLIGIPMYSNAAGIVPVVEALLGKGAALGTVLAFAMSVIASAAPGNGHPARGAQPAHRCPRRRVGSASFWSAICSTQSSNLG